MKTLLWIVIGLLIAALAVVALIRWGGGSGEQTPGDALSRRLLENATYSSLGTKAGTVHLSGGKFENPSARVWVTMLDAVARGDLDEDGRPEAVVVLATNTGGSGVFHSLHVVRDHGGRPSDAAIAELGDRVELKALSVEEGRVVVDMVTHGPSDPMCCPTLRTVQTYELRGSDLVLVDQTPPDADATD
jgi:hypothetical protein